MQKRHNQAFPDIEFNGDYMKKLSLPLLISIMFLFTACTQSQSVNLFQFTENFNRQAAYERIKMSDYLIKDRTFTHFLRDEESEFLLTLEENDEGIIKKIRFTVSKTDDMGKSKPVTDKEAEHYFRNAVQVLSAYSLFSQEECGNILRELIPSSGKRFSEIGELTARWEHYSLAYYSNALCCQLWIYDNFIEEPESTSKPVSRPIYGETANIRED